MLRPTITVYSRPGCVQCVATCRFLDARKMRYHLLNVDDDASAAEHVRSLGHTQLPVVVVTEGERVLCDWSGFRPDLLSELIADCADTDQKV